MMQMNDGGAGLLLVDDEQDALDELSDMFRKRAPLLRVSTSLEEAKRILSNDRRIGVVLTDIRMPGGSGLELLDVARVRARAEAVKVIVLTGYGSVDNTLMALRSRAFDFLIKPASREDILRSVAGAADEVNLQRGGSGAPADGIVAILRTRELRRKLYRGRALPDAAWDVLLNLALARTRGEEMDISSLCRAVDATRTSLWRRLGELTEIGLVLRRPDPKDARRVILAIADEAFATIVDMALRRAT